MKNMFSALVLTLFLSGGLFADELFRKGSSGGPFNGYTLRIPARTADDYPACGQQLRKVFPMAFFEGWTEIEYASKTGPAAGDLIKRMTGVVAAFLDKDSKQGFLSYADLKAVAVEREMEIDCRISITFKRNGERNYVVLHVDSKTGRAYVKYSGGDGVLHFENSVTAPGSQVVPR